MTLKQSSNENNNQKWLIEQSFLIWDKNIVEQKCADIAKNGFVNYFGEQRFGFKRDLRETERGKIRIGLVRRIFLHSLKTK